MDEREPRNRRLGARLQFAENLLSPLLELGMGSFKLLLRLSLDSSSADPGYASKLIQVLVN